jgi:hypothetical protein
MLSVIDAFSTLNFAFKITVKSNASPSAAPTQINAFEFLRRAQVDFISLPPPLLHAKMYANHDAYNDLLAFLEKHELGWTSDTAKTYGHRFIDNMSKAFFHCTPITWTALNDKHNNGALLCFLVALNNIFAFMNDF